MKKPMAINEECKFTTDELFFSTTDSRGKILFGNETFIRISAYEKSIIIGAPHSIIRHPDMPKTVFKLFWDVLKENQPIGAYVKNMSADGRYYWVFALAFPVGDQYISIRIKPTSSILNKVKIIYEKVLQKEDPSKLSTDYLLELLKYEGFSSYREFMIKAAAEELRQRETFMLEDPGMKAKKRQMIRTPISELTERTARELSSSFSKISAFQQAGNILEDSLVTLNREFKKLSFVSVNMNILAAKYGSKAASLEVVSREFAKLSTEISTHFNTFVEFIHETSSAILECTQCLVNLKTQMIMVEDFVTESIERSKHSNHAFDDMIQNQEHFCQLFDFSIKKLNSEITKLSNSSLSLSARLEEIHTFTVGLEVIKLVGAVESSRESETKKDFDVYLLEMTNFINLLKSSVNSIHNQNNLLKTNAKEIQQSNQKIADNISSVFNLALNIGVIA